jgi:hypothetical protein
MVDDTDIDLVNGTILTHPNEHTIAEYIALAFSISLLHVYQEFVSSFVLSLQLSLLSVLAPNPLDGVGIKHGEVKC